MVFIKQDLICIAQSAIVCKITWSFQIARKWKVMGEIIILRHNLMFASSVYLSLDLKQPTPVTATLDLDVHYRSVCFSKLVPSLTTENSNKDRHLANPLSVL